MATRFYEMKGNGDIRDFAIEDFGNTLKMGAIIFQGMGQSFIMVLPSGDDASMDNRVLPVAKPNLEEWSAILRATDDPVFFEQNDLNKPFHRKAQMAVSGAIQQRIWIRDALMCLYCGIGMEKAQLTIDHFIPLEFGGENNDTNYITACRKCNKKKGSIEPEKYCRSHDLDYIGLQRYLKGEIPLHLVMHLSNRMARIGRFKFYEI